MSLCELLHNIVEKGYRVCITSSFSMDECIRVTIEGNGARKVFYINIVGDSHPDNVLYSQVEGSFQEIEAIRREFGHGCQN